MILHRYRKRPRVIQTVQLTEQNGQEVADWCGGHWWQAGQELKIDTLEGRMLAEPGDWIVRGVAGEFYPVKPDIFDATYEAAE